MTISTGTSQRITNLQRVSWTLRAAGIKTVVCKHANGCMQRDCDCQQRVSSKAADAKTIGAYIRGDRQHDGAHISYDGIAAGARIAVALHAAAVPFDWNGSVHFAIAVGDCIPSG